LDIRKEMGRRGDAIIRKCSSGVKLEFGGSEAGKHTKDKMSDLNFQK